MEVFCAHVAAGKPLELPRRAGYVLLIRQAALASPSAAPMRLMVQCDEHPPMVLCVLRPPEKAPAAVALVLSSENSATLTAAAHNGGKAATIDVLGMWMPREFMVSGMDEQLGGGFDSGEGDESDDESEDEDLDLDDDDLDDLGVAAEQNHVVLALVRR